MASSLPFWDPGAAQQANQTTQGGQVTSQQTTYPAIFNALPDLSSQALPESISSWEVVYFAKIRAPGKAVVDGGRRRIVDRIGIPGSSGEIARVMGYGLAEFTVTLTMWTQQQWTSFQSLVRILFPKPQVQQPTPAQLSVAPFLVQPNPNPSPLSYAFDVQHPLFQCHGVSTVYVVDIEGPRPSGFQQVEARISCIEFLRPLSEGAVVITGSESDPPASGGGTPARTLPPDPSSTSTQP